MTVRRAALAFAVLCCLGALTVALPSTGAGAQGDDGSVAEQANAAIERTDAVAELESLAANAPIHYVAGLGVGLGLGTTAGAVAMYARKRREIEERFA